MEKTARINTGRQKELDIARGLAVIFMILIHTVEYYWNEENVFFGKAANFLGSPPAAPVFMFLLGCGIIYSRRNSAAELAKRGLRMLGLSYVLNAFVYVLPYGISALINQDMEIWTENWSQLYDADILQFAALAFLFFALIRLMKLKPWQGVAAAAFISVIGMILNNVCPEVENPFLQAVTGLLWGTHEGSYFPFTSWIMYAAVGFFFGDLLQQTSDKKSLYLKLSPVCGVIFLVLAVVLVRFHEWDAMMDGDCYYHQDIVMNLMFVAFVGAWVGICYAISAVLPASVMGIMKKFSSNVTVIYVIQYILIIYIQVLLVGETVFSAPIILGIAAVYTLAAYWGAAAYKRLIANLKAKRTV